jgi:flagella basal body P-ring formation protein FlgA
METRPQSPPIQFVVTLTIVVVVLALARFAWPQTPQASVVPSDDLSRQSAEGATADVRVAIARAVADRIGGDALVTVTALQTSVAEGTALVANPEPGARTSAPARFVLFDGHARVGTAVATVHVNARHVRARRVIARDEAVVAADVEEVNAPLRNQPMKRVPALSDVIGTRVRRQIAAGEAITTAVVQVIPLVRSGDKVTMVVRVGAVEAEGRGVASGSGHVGDVIRVTNPATRRPLKARITGPGEVEIIQ